MGGLPWVRLGVNIRDSSVVVVVVELESFVLARPTGLGQREGATFRLADRQAVVRQLDFFRSHTPSPPTL